MTDVFSADLVAPCGMNCGVCKAYLAYSRKVPYQKGLVSHCSGCLERNKNCAFIKKGCVKIRKNQLRFCYQCPDMPCENLSKIDAHYQARYGMSMIQNQKDIRDKGMDAFLKTQAQRYRCPNCGDITSVHDGKCYKCNYQAAKPKGTNPKHRWVPNKK
ncbi:MAG: DUF3795 domain-containing protein [Candidatus Bathyarchaeota archaeon]|nr:DUF3795 domain-containing protein [Candidatus Bathyarchaeota archaeon]